MGDVFDADDDLGLFLVSLTAALNDLLYANRLLVPEHGNRRLLRKDPTPAENLYLLRLVLGHLWEALLLIRESSSTPAIAAFLEGLGAPGATECYVSVMAAATDDNDAAYKTLAHVRNKSWHYPRTNDKELRRAVRAAADEGGVLEHQELMPSIRGVFADEIFAKVLTRHTGDDEDALGPVFQRFSAIVGDVIRFGQYALDEYLGRLHAANVTVTRTPA